MDERYNPQQVEAKWQQRWRDEHTYALSATEGKPKYYLLEMFAYPSGDLHMGHVRCYTVGDVQARYRIMKGFHVLHPPGFDAFGLNAENAAIQRQIHPQEWTERNMKRMREQYERMGFAYDWDQLVVTSHPEYYKWTQWLFLQFYKAGLAYKKMAPVNWCPSCATALANEQVKEGLCERCDSVVTKKPLNQWFFRITRYADRLLENHAKLDWPEEIKVMQRNWIGRSTGVEVDFTVKGSGQKVPVFTTRVDTLFGVTYMVLAPEHPLVDELVKGTEREAAVREFQERMARQSEIERTAADAPKEGIPLGAEAINPANGEPVPIWIANYVLLEYGTGAVMGVPAHDTRDFAFAAENGLPIRQVIAPPEGVTPSSATEAYVEPGVQVNSGQFDGLPSEEAKERIADWLEERGVGRRQVNTRLRDWLLSRQRYWGAPIPIVYCDQCGEQPVPEDQLPVVLPSDVAFTGKGESPLAGSPSFVNTTCPQCGGPATRDVDTMDTFVDSSWYFLRFASPREADRPWDPGLVSYWLPVDQYVGGREHATMHLIYARFVTQALHDLGHLPFDEPFIRLFNQGTVYLHGKKMSKSRGNVVPLDAMCDEYGADTARCFELFIAPPDEQAEWNEQGVEGVWRFLRRAYTYVASRVERFQPDWRAALAGVSLGGDDQAVRRKTHQTLLRVTEDVERFHYNTAVAALMELVNELYVRPNISEAVFSEAAELLTLMLSPFAPHLAEELWEGLGRDGHAAFQTWPEADPAVAREDTVEVVVQVNGKIRDRLSVPAETSKEELERLALASEKVRSQLEGLQVKKAIVVPGKLVNLVVGK